MKKGGELVLKSKARFLPKKRTARALLHGPFNKDFRPMDFFKVFSKERHKSRRLETET
jgi:hypothetical protein